MVTKNKKSAVIFGQKPGEPKRPLPHHERRAIMERHLVSRNERVVVTVDNVSTKTECAPLRDSLIPTAVAVKEEKLDVVISMCENDMWQGIVTKKMPQLNDYEKDGVHYKDIPYSTKVKKLGRIIIAIRTETKNKKFRSFSLFQNDKGKIWSEETIDKTIKSISSIIKMISDGRELSEGNKKLLQEALKKEKIVIVP